MRFFPGKKSGWEGAEAYNELQEICSTETQECSSRWPKTKSKMQFLKKGSRSEEEHHAPAVCQEERSKGMSVTFLIWQDVLVSWFFRLFTPLLMCSSLHSVFMACHPRGCHSEGLEG